MKRFVGLVLLIAAIGAVVFYAVQRRSPAPGAPSASPAPAPRPQGPLTVVRGLVGGEKSGLLADPAIVSVLAERYGLKVDADKRGSIEMVTGDVGGNDFLWPSSEFAREVFLRRSPGARDVKFETVFNSPIVFYSWVVVTDALQRQKIVEKRGDSYFLSDATGLVKMIASARKWNEIGLPQLYGRVTIYSTDPTRSNSGTMFAALLATLLNDGDIVDEASVGRVLPQVKQAFARMGYMEGSSSDLFRSFLNTGVGANPIIVGYENQMIEYGVEHQDQVATLQQNVRVLYPQPTIWSAHPVIALTEGGQRLLRALKDPDVQRLAWERHGFRSGLLDVHNDVRAVQAIGVPPRIESVVPMPSSEVMQRILDELKPSGSAK